jgi:hypothetical protein
LCTNLTSVTIPGSVTNIGEDAFGGCFYLTNAIIGDGVTSVGDYAFSGCERLVNIYFSGNAPTFGMDVFWSGNFNDPVTLYYPLGTTGWPASGVYVWQVVRPLFNYTTNAGTIIITGFSEAGSTVILPSTINGIPVTRIGDEAFFQSSVANVLIPGTVTSIGDLAFYGSTNLTSLTIPGSVTNIGQFAFYGCTSLGSLTITGDTTIGYGPGQIPPYLANPATTDASTSIADAAFYGCTSLTNLTLTEGVVSLGDLSFYGCTSLASLTIPESVTNIGDGAFGYCTSLTNVFFDGNAPAVGSSAFFSDNATVSYVFGATGFTSPFAGLPVVVENPFCYTTNAGTIAIVGLNQAVVDMTIPATINGLPVTSIADNAFFQNQLCETTLTSVTIPGSVTSVGATAFEFCTVLTTVTIANGVTSIGGGAFSDCFSLASVTIPASVTNIGGDPFFYCSSLAAITVDTQNPFYSSLNGVLFDKAHATLLEYPAGVSGSYAVPDSVTSISAGAFGNCAELTGITIPTGVTSIGEGAFADCTSLTSVTIPASVTNIGGSAFEACLNLKNVFFTGNAPNADSSVFEAYNTYRPVPVTVYYLPGATGWSNSFAGHPALLWNPAIQIGDGNFGVQNGQFGFNITNAANLTVVVEVCTNLASPVWVPLATNTLANGVFHFSEPFQANSSGRFYGLGLP